MLRLFLINDLKYTFKRINKFLYTKYALRKPNFKMSQCHSDLLTNVYHFIPILFQYHIFSCTI